MSKEVISQRMKQTCEGCGKIVEWELVGADQNLQTLTEMQQWFQVGRKAVIGGQMVQLTADACSPTCASVAAVKLSNPPESEEQPDQIDLQSLRAANLAN